jgi:hypothetical protein
MLFSWNIIYGAKLSKLVGGGGEEVEGVERDVAL